MKSVLVAGSTNFIGYHSVDELTHRGIKVTILTATPASSKNADSFEDIMNQMTLYYRE